MDQWSVNRFTGRRLAYVIQRSFGLEKVFSPKTIDEKKKKKAKRKAKAQLAADGNEEQQQEGTAEARRKAKMIAQTAPFDGQWRVEWTTHSGDKKHRTIYVKDNKFEQAGILFHLDFLDLVHPHIKWPTPGNRQTVQEGVNLIDEPDGPIVGACIRWTTTSTQFPELYWIRETNAHDEASLKAKQEAKLKAEAKARAKAKKEAEIISSRKPLDGTWSVQWIDSSSGKDRQMEIEVKEQ